MNDTERERGDIENARCRETGKRETMRELIREVERETKKGEIKN